MNQDRSEKKGRRCVVYIPESMQRLLEEAFGALGMVPVSAVSIARLAVRFLESTVSRRGLAPIVKLIEDEQRKKIGKNARKESR